KYTNIKTSRLEIFTNVQVMFVVQLLVPSGGRWKSSMDVTVVVELASRIQDLVQNESGELLAHGVDPISRVTFIPHLRHLSFRNKRINIMCVSTIMKIY